MGDWWHDLQRMVEGLLDDELDEEDPALAFHLLFMAPLLIGLLAMARH